MRHNKNSIANDMMMLTRLNVSRFVCHSTTALLVLHFFFFLIIIIIIIVVDTTPHHLTLLIESAQVSRVVTTHLCSFIKNYGTDRRQSSQSTYLLTINQRVSNTLRSSQFHDRRSRRISSYHHKA